MREKAQINVRGNHDRVCCGLTSALGFNPVARAAAMWTNKELTAENLAWLKGVPSGPIQPEEAGVTCVHGSPLNEDQYILSMRDAWAPLSRWERRLRSLGIRICRVGFRRRTMTGTRSNRSIGQRMRRRAGRCRFRRGRGI